MRTVGQILREERENRKIDIKEVENGTSIRALYISSIENDDYAKIPGEVYVKGFIRNYANYLGLNAEELVGLYRQSQMPVVEKISQPTAAEITKSKELEKDTKPKSKSLLVGFVLVCVIAVVWWLFSSTMFPRLSQDIKPIPAVPAPAIPAPAIPAPVAPTAPPVPVKPAGKAVIVSAKFTGQCWTVVRADGKEVYEGIPNVGDVLTWDADKIIDIKLGNAGVVELVYNNVPVGKLGEKGDVVVKTFSASPSKP